MTSELEKYKRQGMPDCLGKPFTSQELWHILLKYLVPIGTMPSGTMPTGTMPTGTPPTGSAIIDGDENDAELQKKLRANFLKNNQTVHAKITEAVVAGDMKQAHRLAHSLKGNAGMPGKTGVRDAAAEVEALLKEDLASVWETKMNTLKTELMLVLEELNLASHEQPDEVQQEPQTQDAGQVMALFEKLEPMLENINPECVNLIDEIRTVPGAEDLAQQIENYDFESAAGTLIELKKKWEKYHV
jgi:HPt (histidine-containing phosphotransfer) domain-containing protein